MPNSTNPQILSKLAPSGVTNNLNTPSDKSPGYQRPKTNDPDMRNIFDNLDFLRGLAPQIVELRREIDELKSRIKTLEDAV